MTNEIPGPDNYLFDALVAAIGKTSAEPPSPERDACLAILAKQLSDLSNAGAAAPASEAVSDSRHVARGVSASQRGVLRFDADQADSWEALNAEAMRLTSSPVTTDQERAARREAWVALAKRATALSTALSKGLEPGKVRPAESDGRPSFDPPYRQWTSAQKAPQTKITFADSRTATRDPIADAYVAARGESYARGRGPLPRAASDSRPLTANEAERAANAAAIGTSLAQHEQAQRSHVWGKRADESGTLETAYKTDSVMRQVASAPRERDPEFNPGLSAVSLEARYALAKRESETRYMRR